MKTSITVVYRIATNQQYFPSVKGGFFMTIPVSWLIFLKVRIDIRVYS